MKAYRIFYAVSVILAVIFAVLLITIYFSYIKLRSNPLVLVAPFSHIAARLCLMLLTPAGICAIIGYFRQRQSN